MAAAPRLDHPRGDEAVVLEHAYAVAAPWLRGHVAGFYATVGERTGPSKVIARLRPAERTRLLNAQVEHVRQLFDPSVDDLARVARGREIGRIHAMAGVDLDWFVEAVSDHERALFWLLDANADRVDVPAAIAALSRRFMLDLQGVMQGYRALDQAQSHVLGRIGHVAADARTLTDLAREVLETIGTLDGVVSAFLGRPDDAGNFFFEAGTGLGVEEVTTWALDPLTVAVRTGADSPEGRGPSGEAWRTGEIVRCDAYQTDPATRPWRAWGRRFGWRSSVAVPLSDPQGQPFALLSIYARWPGYFGYDSRVAMIEQVRLILERAMWHLSGRPGAASVVQPYDARVSHQGLLATGAVQMLYQPIVTLPGGRVDRFEALARLRDGDQLVSPAEFLPAFGDEELFRLFEIGLTHSLTALREWEAQGLRTSVSLNMPVVATSDERYVRAVTEALRRHRVAPHRLVLELLETGTSMGSLATRQAALGRFKQIGVQLAQDDLGSGHSSLLRLRHFAFDHVKIDQNLVHGSENAPRESLGFIQPISDLAHGLGLHVTLEGVENPGLIEAAVQLGVDAAQGYGIARPMPGDAVTGWTLGHRLDVERDHPRTVLGALAAHVAWEHRVTALGDEARLLLGSLRGCALDAFLRTRDATEAARAHEMLHHAVLGRVGGTAHRKAWHHLKDLVEASSR